ncbi:zinc-ribbon domain-containing protein [Chloroflexota bacterium]
MGDEHKIEREKRFCPYCDEELAETSFPYCKACEVEVFYCPQCREPLPRDKRECPSCGAEIKG